MTHNPKKKERKEKKMTKKDIFYLATDLDAIDIDGMDYDEYEEFTKKHTKPIAIARSRKGEIKAIIVIDEDKNFYYVSISTRRMNEIISRIL